MGWTNHSEPIAGPGGAGPGGAGTPPGGSPPGGASGGPPAGTGAPTFAAAGGGAVAPKVDTWLWQSIVATVLCCLPLGIPAIIFASQANTEVSNGNYALAQDKAKQAKTFTLIAVGLGLLLWIGWVSAFFLPFMFMGF